MEQIIDNTSYSEKEIYKINECGIYLQVFTIADVTNGDGSQVTGDAITKQRDVYHSSKWNWPERAKPPESAWKK